MADIIEDIVKINVTTQAQGLGSVNFGIPCFFVLPTDLNDGIAFEAGTMRVASTIRDVAELFRTDSHSYLMASRWFAAAGVGGFMYMREDTTDPVADATDARSQNFFYHTFFTSEAFADHEKALALADWADANTAYMWIGMSEADAYDSENETNLLAKLFAKGNRHVSVAPRLASTLQTDPSQIYAIYGEAALFSRVNYQGIKTAITAEHKSIAGVIGENLNNTQYKAVKQKKGTMFTRIEVGDQVDSSVSINTWSMSSAGEFADDVINTDALASAFQIAAYNLFRRVKKVELTPSGQALQIAEAEKICRQFYTNGVLGAGYILNPLTQEREFCEYGYKIYTQPEDILDISSALKAKREMVPINLRVNFSRAGHSITYDITIV